MIFIEYQKGVEIVMKVLINTELGGWFQFSETFLEKYPQFENIDEDKKQERVNTELIETVKSFGLDKAGSAFSNLEIIEIPNDISDFEIEEFDGYEWVVYARKGLIYKAWGKNAY